MTALVQDDNTSNIGKRFGIQVGNGVSHSKTINLN
jgi:hypothetical protein